jgi:hypothetical protein
VGFLGVFFGFFWVGFFNANPDDNGRTQGIKNSTATLNSQKQENVPTLPSVFIAFESPTTLKVYKTSNMRAF